MIKLSNRLSHVAALVPTGAVLADVGTDHGYIPIALVQQGRIQRALAMDIGKGPLERAKVHIRANGLEHCIETRLSDGLMGLKAGEADCVVIAGMGGGIVIHILQTGTIREKGIGTLILQPQSEIHKVREYLVRKDYEIVAEDMVYEDGKYYPMMKVKVQAEQLSAGELPDPQGIKQQVEFLYGKHLLAQRHPVLKQYLAYELQIKEKIKKDLEKNEKNTGIIERLEEIEYDITKNQLAQKILQR